MTAPRGDHNSGDGSFARDAGTQTTKAVVLVAVVVIVAVLALSKLSSSPHTSAAASRSPATTVAPATTTVPATTTTTTPPPAPASVKVLVFNGTTAPRGAGYFSTKLKALNYDTLAPEDANTTTVTTSVVYVNVPGYLSSAANIAQALGLPSTAVQPALPVSAPVSSAVVRTNSPDVVVLVGTDISGQSLGTTTTTATTR